MIGYPWSSLFFSSSVGLGRIDGYANEKPHQKKRTCTDNLCIEKVSHYWLTLLVICMATYMPNFGLVR